MFQTTDQSATLYHSIWGFLWCVEPENCALVILIRKCFGCWFPTICLSVCQFGVDQNSETCYS